MEDNTKIMLPAIAIRGIVPLPSNEFKIEVSLLTKYLDYRVEKETKKFVSGDKEVRVEKFVKLIFTKVKNAKKLGVARACQGCGANLDLNFDGRCPYCGAIFNLQEYDWILEDIL